MIKLDDRILSKVQKPTRYTGGELNAIIKNPESLEATFAFCFPDVYEIGMSHLGIKILYHLLNSLEAVSCERVFTPWPDMQEQMKENNIPLFSLETKEQVSNFDIVGFTLQYEMCYTNVLNMLDLAGIPLYSKDRGEDCPFVCAGGPCAYNCEPLADFLDFVMMGEGEEVICEVMDELKRWKKSGGKRIDFLKSIAKIEGIYVPSFYDIFYREDGTVASIIPNQEEAKPVVRKRIIEDLDHVFYPEKIIVPFGEVVFDRIMLEVFRGCIRGCRFCQAGYIYRPVREKSPDTLMHSAECLIQNTGYEEISLSSLSTSDYTRLPELAERLTAQTEQAKVSLSLPSLRIDNFSIGLMQQVQKVRKSGLTFAPEAGSQRLRDVINKGISEEDVTRSAELAFRGGWNNIKLYFMIGLPTETDEDVIAIADLARTVIRVYDNIPKSERAKNVKVTVSVSSFVPKAFTPFQWEKQDTAEELVRKQKLLQGAISDKRISLKWHESSVSNLEGVFSRGDRRLAAVLVAAYRNGCIFDSWDEYFRPSLWEKAFADCGIDPAFYNRRKRSLDEKLPWEHIDIGVSNEFMKRECQAAYEGKTTSNCREKCAGCGANCFGGGVCYE
jgi:radical SAM family uncharacterized protein